MPQYKIDLKKFSFVNGLVIGVSVTLIILTAFLHPSLRAVFAGKAGLPGNNKNPDWYTTCTGADPSNPDQTPPTISFVSPSSGTYVKRKAVVNFKIDSTDNVSLNRNELYVNGVLRGVVYSSIAPYTHGWAVPTNATPGTVYSVYSKTCDMANNYAVTPIIQLIAQ